MPQLGDALMDLAPRSLLMSAGLQVDLVVAPHLCELFQGDPWLHRVLSIEQPATASYDAAILLSDDRRSLRYKRRHLANLPWLSLHGLYNGPDFHRARFAAQRLADLLGITSLDAATLANHARQKLGPDPEADAWAAGQAPGDGWIVLALGGVAADRTYTRWPGLVHSLAAQGWQRWVLIGSANGRPCADAVVSALAGRHEVLDLVGRGTLRQARALAGRARLVLCADGGLMHLALTTMTPVLALFGAGIEPSWRLPESATCIGLSSPSHRVDDLPPDLVAATARRLAVANP